MSDVDSEEEKYAHRGTSTRNVPQTKVFDIKTTQGKSYPGVAEGKMRRAQENTESDESSDEEGIETENTVPCPITSSRTMNKHAAAEEVEVMDEDGVEDEEDAPLSERLKRASGGGARTQPKTPFAPPPPPPSTHMEGARRMAHEEREEHGKAHEEKVQSERALQEKADAEKAQREKEQLAANKVEAEEDRKKAKARKAEAKRAEEAHAQINAEKAAARAINADRAAASPEDQTVARQRYRIGRTQSNPPSTPTSPPHPPSASAPKDALRPLGRAVHGDVGMLNTPAPAPAPAIKLLADKPLAEPPAKPRQPPLQPPLQPVPPHLAELRRRNPESRDPRLPPPERPVTPTMPEGGLGEPWPLQPSTPPETKPSGSVPRPPNSDGAPSADALNSPAAVTAALAAANARCRARGATHERATHERAPVQSLTARDEILREREMAAAPAHQPVATAEAEGVQATVASARAALPFERNNRDKQGRMGAWEAKESARKRHRGQTLRWEAKRPRQHEYERGGRYQRDDDASRREKDLALREARLKRDEANLEYDRALHRQQHDRSARDDRYNRGNDYYGRVFKR